MIDVALSILAFIAGGLILELFASATSAAATDQTPLVTSDPASLLSEDLFVCNPS
jgi:hypothetical protein